MQGERYPLHAELPLLPTPINWREFSGSKCSVRSNITVITWLYHMPCGNRNASVRWSASELNGLVFTCLVLTERLFSLALAWRQEERDCGQDEQYERDPGERVWESVVEHATEPRKCLDALVHVVQHVAKHFYAHHRRRRYAHRYSNVEHKSTLHDSLTNVVEYKIESNVHKLFRHITE